MRPSLYVYNRPVFSYFGLPDTNEKQVTYALGFILAKCDKLRNELFRISGLHTINIWDPVEIKIEENKPIDGKRLDIEIKLNKEIRLIIEGKIGDKEPDFEQIQSYLDILLANPSKNERRLLIIFDELGKDEIDRYMVDLKKYLDKKKTGGFTNISTTTWPEIQFICRNIVLESPKCEDRDILQEYYWFLESERYKTETIDRIFEKEDLDENQINYLKKIIKRFRDYGDEFKFDQNWKIELVPGIYDTNYAVDYLGYYYISYRKSFDEIFGLRFNCGETEPEVHIFFEIAPDKLKESDNMRIYYDIQSEKNKAYYDPEWGYLFDISDNASDILTNLKDQRFFKTAFELAK